MLYKDYTAKQWLRHAVQKRTCRGRKFPRISLRFFTSVLRSTTRSRYACLKISPTMSANVTAGLIIRESKKPAPCALMDAIWEHD